MFFCQKQSGYMGNPLKLVRWEKPLYSVKRATKILWPLTMWQPKRSNPGCNKGDYSGSVKTERSL